MKVTIQPHELMVGNYIDFEVSNGTVVMSATNGVVTSIDQDTLKINGFTIPRYDMLRAIPLTDQWLKDLGFEETREKDKSVDRDGIWYNEFDLYEYFYEENVFNFATRVKHGEFKSGYQIVYVHQLQNLYMSITGKQLTKVEIE